MSLNVGLQQKAILPLLDMDSPMVPRPSAKDGMSQADFDFMASLLRDLSRWMSAKKKPATGEKENAQFPTNPDQIWRGDLSPRDPYDPMGNFIAKIGEA